MQEGEYLKLAQAEKTMWWFQAMHELVLTELTRANLPRSTRLLDAGCGTGGVLRKVARHFEHYSIYGLDYSETAVEVARKKSQAIVSVGSINKLPFPSERFDAIVSLDVLCHEGVSVDDALSEFYRCLVPNGVLILNLPAYQWMLSEHDRAVSNVRRFTFLDVKQTGCAAGLRMESGGYWNSILFPLMVLHRLIRRGNTGSDVVSFPVWQEWLFNRLLRFEAKLRRRGLTLPFGGSVWVRFRKPSRQ